MTLKEKKQPNDVVYPPISEQAERLRKAGYEIIEGDDEIYILGMAKNIKSLIT